MSKKVGDCASFLTVDGGGLSGAGRGLPIGLEAPERVGGFPSRNKGESINQSINPRPERPTGATTGCNQGSSNWESNGNLARRIYVTLKTQAKQVHTSN